MTSLTNLFKEISRFVPFSSLIMPSRQSNTQVDIKIFEKFNNKDFGLDTIEFLMSNQQMFIKSV